MSIFTILTKAIIIILPFYVFLAIYLSKITWIDKIWFLFKEWLLVVIFFSLIYEFFKAKKFPKFDILDYLIFFYIWYWIIITIINWLWIDSIIHWWRYDFMFLIVLQIYKHWSQFLKISPKKLLEIFLYSGLWALLISILIKFRLKEEFLMEFWYVDYVSSWVFSWWVPIYHWLENSWIRRFQWIFDSPSAMWYFLILLSATFLYLQKKKTEFYVIATLIFMFWLVIITYSRSAVLWIISWIWLLVLLNFKHLYKTYKKYLTIIITTLIIFVAWFSFIFQDQLKNIVLRTSSTTWHSDRMMIWIERFKEKPLGSWLAEAWPWYRNIYPNKQTKKDEQYYIPESWFIQVLIEWWIIFFMTFLAILWIILKRLYYNSKIFFWALIAILVMNFFLHIFEATYLSILTFLLIWLLISKK